MNLQKSTWEKVSMPTNTSAHTWRMVLLNTDWEPFGGSTKRKNCKAIPETLPAFGGMLFSLTQSTEHSK